MQHVILAVLKLPDRAVPEILNVLARHDPALISRWSDSTEDDVDLAESPVPGCDGFQL